MASRNSLNSSNNPNGQRSVTLFNGTQPYILDPNQYRLWRQRFDDMKKKLEVAETQGEAAFARYNVVQRLESMADAGRKAQLALKALQDGQLQVMNTEDTRRALAYANDGNAMVNNAAINAYPVAPAITSNQSSASIQASQMQASSMSASTSVNTFHRTQTQPNYVQQSSAGFNVPHRAVRGSSSTQQSHVQAANRQHNDDLSLARAELAARLLAYSEEFRHRTDDPSDTSTGQVSNQHLMDRSQTQQPYALSQQGASGSSNAQSMGLYENPSPLINNAPSVVGTSISGPSSTHQSIYGTTMSPFTSPPSYSTVNNTSSASLSSPSIFYPTSSSSLAGALDDISHTQASSTSYTSHGSGGNGIQEAAQIDFSSYLITPPHSEDMSTASQMRTEDVLTSTSARSTQAAPFDVKRPLRGAMRNVQATPAHERIRQPRNDNAQNVQGAHRSTIQAPHVALAIALQSQQTRTPTPTSSNIAHTPAFASANPESARGTDYIRNSQLMDLLPPSSSLAPPPSSNQYQYQGGQFWYTKPAPHKKKPTFSVQLQDQYTQSQGSSLYNNSFFQQLGNIKNTATNIHGNTSSVGAQGGSGPSSTYQLGQSTQTQTLNNPMPRTPQSTQPFPAPQVTPANADRKRLAKDILRALGRPSKRKASKSRTLTSEQEPGVKKRVLEHLSGTSLEHPVYETDSAGEVEKAMALSDISAVDTSKSAEPMTEGIALESHTTDGLDMTNTEKRISAESALTTSGLPDLDTALQPFEDPSNPLFLPSPEPSPTRTDNSRIVPGPTPGLQVIVEVPLLPASLRKRFMRQPSRERKKKVKKEVSEASSELQGNMGSNFDIGERLLLALKTEDVAATRLRRRPCLWADCPHISNATYKLKIHVQDHVDSLSRGQKLFHCQWKMCSRRFLKSEALSQHLQNHVRKTMICAYQECDDQFSHPLHLHAHVMENHKGGKLRPASTPFQHLSIKKIPPLKTMLSFYDVHLPVQMQRLTKERRAKIGPWVAKNMYGVVNFSVPLHKSARQIPRGGRRDDDPKESDLKMKGGWHDKYDFLEMWDTSCPSYCDDLESRKATENVEKGILLAPDAEGPQGPLEEQYFTSLAERLKESDVKKYAIKEDQESEGVEYNEVKSEELEDELSRASLPEVTAEQLQPNNSALTDEMEIISQQPEVSPSQDVSSASEREEIAVASVL